MSDSTKNKRRIFHMLIVILLGFAAIFGKLYILQINDTTSYTEANINLIEKSVSQRKQEFILSNGRGNIYYRNMESLLEQEEIRTVIIFPFTKTIVASNKLKELAEIIDLSYDVLLKQINDNKSPSYLTKNSQPIQITTSQQQQIDELSISGIIATTYTIQDTDNVLAKHVIGYLGQAPEVIQSRYSDYVEQGILNLNSLIGRSGLQKTFQELLMGVGQSKVSYFVDNTGLPLNGLSTKYAVKNDPYYPLSLVTTIDKEIQQEATSLLAKHAVQDGSIVVLDARNADILGIASAPNFNLVNVNPNSTTWNNKAVQVIEPGSIFKTIIAIAGLEEGVVTPEERFYCDGEIEKYHFTCYKVHGELTFEEAYAQSCNITFAAVAERLGAAKIEDYAKYLGFVGNVGWTGEFFKNESFKQIDNEDSNRVYHPNTNTDDLGSIIRTAIGQQDVRISPLAGANLIVTVLNNGVVYQPRLVEKVIYKNGNDYYNFPIHRSNIRVGNVTTYQEIRSMMEQVVTEGTATLLNGAKWQLAGKTGTAETNNDLNNQWFIGYGPTESPQYAVAVAIKNVNTNKQIAKQIFLELMNYLAE